MSNGDTGTSAFEDDLTGVITHLKSFAKPRGGSIHRSPNTERVRHLLEAGVEALAERFTKPIRRRPTEWEKSANDVMGAIRIEDVMSKYELLGRQRNWNAGDANPSQLRTQWGDFAQFQHDLVEYLFRPFVYQQKIQQRLEGLGDSMRLTFGELVEQLAAAETDEVQSDPVLQLQLALQTAYPNDYRIQRLAARQYAAQVEAWSSIYELIMASYDVTFSAAVDVTTRDVAVMLNVIVSGAYVRRQAEESLGELEDGSHVAVRLIQLLLCQITDRSWSDLASLRVVAQA